MDTCGSRWLHVAMGDYEWLRVATGGYGWLRVVTGGGRGCGIKIF